MSVLADKAVWGKDYFNRQASAISLLREQTLRLDIDRRLMLEPCASGPASGDCERQVVTATDCLQVRPTRRRGSRFPMQNRAPKMDCPRLLGELGFDEFRRTAQ